MEIGKAILLLIGLIIISIGVIFIYDARVIIKKWFSFGDQNEGTSGFKILGIILSFIGVLIIFFNLKV